MLLVAPNAAVEAPLPIARAEVAAPALVPIALDGTVAAPPLANAALVPPDVAAAPLPVAKAALAAAGAAAIPPPVAKAALVPNGTVVAAMPGLAIKMLLTPNGINPGPALAANIPFVISPPFFAKPALASSGAAPFAGKVIIPAKYSNNINTPFHVLRFWINLTT